MKQYVLGMSVILCLVMFGIAAAQEQTKEQQKPDKVVKAQTGEVLSVDPSKNEIVIKDDAGAEIRLLIGVSTKITKAGKTISLGDVKTGDKVSSECEVSSDGCKAKSIMVMPPPPSR